MKLYVATRKGLFVIVDGKIGAPHFLGDPVTAVLADGRDLYAALNLGHFGVKLRRSSNGGEAWEEIAAPAYPPQPAEEKTLWILLMACALFSSAVWQRSLRAGLEPDCRVGAHRRD